MKSDLVDQAQSSYIQLLAAEVAKQPRAHVEPAMRNRDGELATEGRLELPCRLDLVPPDGSSSQTVTSNPREIVRSETVKVGACQVLIRDFAWDALTLTAQGLPLARFDSTCKAWFLRWFDPEDKNPASAAGLYGVVHFMSDPMPEHAVVRTQLDLGSAPVVALTEVIEELASMGASTVQLE